MSRSVFSRVTKRVTKVFRARGAVATVKFEDLGLTKMVGNLQRMKRIKLHVGYQPPEGGERYEEGVSVAKLAAIMEFGSEGNQLPERSFLRGTLHEKASEIQAREQEELSAVARGEKTPVEALSAVGSFVVGLIRTRIKTAAAWAAPLDPETVERKGSTLPLFDTGKLAEALSWRVSLGKVELARGTE